MFGKIFVAKMATISEQTVECCSWSTSELLASIWSDRVPGRDPRPSPRSNSLIAGLAWIVVNVGSELDVEPVTELLWSW